MLSLGNDSRTEIIKPVKLKPLNFQLSLKLLLLLSAKYDAGRPKFCSPENIKRRFRDWASP